jgi:nucleotide-binding universal stress UspA family protein
MATQQTLPRDTTRTVSSPNGKLFLVASDGRPDSDPAFQLGKLLAGSSGSVRAVAVVDQVNLVTESQILFTEEVETARRNELQERVRAQMLRTLEGAGEFDVYDGDPARVIAQTALRSGATMILAGIGRHGVPARLFGNETVLRVMRLSELPVLAVARDMRHLPRRIVAAIDFSEASLRALRLAVSIAAPGATISLTHVGPRDSMLFDWDKSYKRNILAALNALKEQLELPAGVVFNAVLLQGDAATELLAHAKSLDADLIATGTHGHGFVARLIIGSVATRLVRGSSCSVLTVPRAPERPAAGFAASDGRALIPAQWSGLLDDVSKQNAGRLATLEEDGVEVGAQIEERALPFMGASYDPYDGHVHLMFSASDGSRNHLTHRVSGVSSIAVLQDNLGRDVAIRIGHVGGQALLSFRPDSRDF